MFRLAVQLRYLKPIKFDFTAPSYHIGGTRFVMKRQEAISLLSGNADVIRSLGVDALYLFGSTARDEAREGSDVDLFFDYEDGRVFTLVDLITLRDAITTILNRDADVIARNSLHAYLRPKIEAEAVRVL